MTRVLYLTKAKLSLSRAHGQNILRTAEYMQKTGRVAVGVVSLAHEQKTQEEICVAKGIDFAGLDVTSRRRSVLGTLIRRRDSFDILYFRDPYLWYAASFARFVLGKKVIFEVHGNREWRFGGSLWRLAARAANGAVFITKRLQAAYHLRKPSVVVHTNAVRLEDYAGASRRSELRLPEGSIAIMYLGSFLWYSMDVLVDMMKELPDTYELVVVGAKEAEAGALTRILSSRRVYPVGRVSPRDVPAYLVAADILVNPLAITYEGSISSKLYEYLAAGKPIISSLGGANDEVLLDGVNALIVGLSGKQFADAAKRIESDDHLRAMLAKNARESAREYTWERRAEVILGLIEKI